MTKLRTTDRDRIHQRDNSVGRVWRVISKWSWLAGSASITVVIFGLLTFLAVFDSTKTLQIGAIPKALSEEGVDQEFIAKEINSRVGHLMNIAYGIDQQFLATASRATIGDVHAADDTLAPLLNMTKISGVAANAGYESRRPSIENATFFTSSLSPEGVAALMKRYLHLSGRDDTVISVSLSGSSKYVSATVRIESGSGSAKKIIETPPLTATVDNRLSDAAKAICDEASIFIFRSTAPLDYALYLAARGHHLESRLLLNALMVTQPSYYAQANMRLGNLDLDEGRFGDAEKHYEEALHSGLRWVWMNIGRLRYKQNRLLDAISITEDHIGAGRDVDDRVLSLNNVGAYYSLLGQQQLAQAYFHRALKYDPGAVMPLSNLCQATVAQKSSDAITYCAAYYEATPNDESAAFLLAKALYPTNPREAQDYVKPLERRDPDLALTAWALWIAAREGEGHGEQVLRDHMTSFDGREGAYEYALASVQFENGLFVRAAANFVTAGSLGWRRYDALKSAGASYWRAGQPDAASAWLREAAESAPSDGQRYWDLAELATTLGNDRKALPLFAMARQAGQHSAVFFDNWGRILENLGRRDEADEMYRLALGENPSSPAYYVDHGDILLATIGPGSAREYYRKALQLHPNYLLAINGLAHSDLNDQRTRRARHRLEAVVAELPHSRADSGQQESETDLHEGLTAIFYTLGRAYLQPPQRDLVKAERAFRKCLEYSERHEGCQTDLGVTLEQQKNYAAAADAWIQALRFGTSDPVLYNNVARVVINESRYGLAWCRLVPSDNWPNAHPPQLLEILTAVCRK